MLAHVIMCICTVSMAHISWPDYQYIFENSPFFFNILKNFIYEYMLSQQVGM